MLKPPVGNEQVYKQNDDFIVMVVGGPNARKDFHYNQGEELFYQLKGQITVRIKVDNQFEEVVINEGDMFLLPPRVPHLPKRGADTVGLVIERYRKPNELDGFMWFCENCNYPLHEVYVHVNDIVNQLPIVMNEFYGSLDKCTCKNCGYVMQKP